MKKNQNTAQLELDFSEVSKSWSAPECRQVAEALRESADCLILRAEVLELAAQGFSGNFRLPRHWRN